MPSTAARETRKSSEVIEIAEPFPPQFWPQAWAWYQPFRARMDDASPSTPGEFVEAYLRLRNARTFGLWKDGILSGVVAAESFAPGVRSVHILLARRLWGIEALTQAETEGSPYPRIRARPGAPTGSTLRRIARALFESEPELRRIQAFVPAWNRIARSLCRRLGGTEEGVLRAALLRAGEPADCVIFGLTREEFADGGISRRVVRESVGIEPEFGIELDDLLASAGRVAIDAGGSVLEPDSVARNGVDAFERDGGADGKRELDQSDQLRTDGTPDEVSGRSRVRKQRANRPGGAAGRTRKRKRPRAK